MKTANAANAAYTRLASTSPETAVTNSEISTTSTAYVRVRSSALTMPTTPSVLDLELKNNASDVSSCASGWLVITASGLNPSTISSAADQAFAYGAATTSSETIRVTDGPGGTITDANELRITIATATVNMRWGAVYTANLSGTAWDSSRVTSNTVSYENDGATLVIQVANDFQPANISISAGSRSGISTP